MRMWRWPSGLAVAAVLSWTPAATAAPVASAPHSPAAILSNGATMTVPQGSAPAVAPAASTGACAGQEVIPRWLFSFVSGGSSVMRCIYGTDPSNAGKGTTTVIPVDLIPVKLVLGSAVEDPKKAVFKKQSVMKLTLHSPLFEKSVDYVQGGVDLGKTQYIDAVQRASFWGAVASHPKYHLLFKPKVVPEVTVTLDATSGQDCGSFFDVSSGTLLGDFLSMESSLVPPGTVAVFQTVNAVDTGPVNQPGSCASESGVDGFHITDGITIWASWDTHNVGSLAHELAELVNHPGDPSDTPSPCGNPVNSYEVADPLEGTPPYPYKLKGFTYDLPDIALPPYFGAPPATSVNGWTTFQGQSISVCQNGG